MLLNTSILSLTSFLLGPWLIQVGLYVILLSTFIMFSKMLTIIILFLLKTWKMLSWKKFPSQTRVWLGNLHIRYNCKHRHPVLPLCTTDRLSRISNFLSKELKNRNMTPVLVLGSLTFLTKNLQVSLMGTILKVVSHASCDGKKQSSVSVMSCYSTY